MSKQMKAGTYNNCERWHQASGFSNHQGACALPASGLRASLYVKLILLLSNDGKPFPLLPSLAQIEIWVGIAKTKLQ